MRALQLIGYVDDDHLSSVVIDLTEDCENCKGRGKIIDFERETFTACGADGCLDGQVVNPAGDDLRDFIRTFCDGR